MSAQFDDMTEYALMAEEYDEARSIAGFMREQADAHPEDAEKLAGITMRGAIREAKAHWEEETRRAALNA